MGVTVPESTLFYFFLTACKMKILIPCPSLRSCCALLRAKCTITINGDRDDDVTLPLKIFPPPGTCGLLWRRSLMPISKGDVEDLLVELMTLVGKEESSNYKDGRRKVNDIIIPYRQKYM